MRSSALLNFASDFERRPTPTDIEYKLHSLPSFILSFVMVNSVALEGDGCLICRTAEAKLAELSHKLNCSLKVRICCVPWVRAKRTSPRTPCRRGWQNCPYIVVCPHFQWCRPPSSTKKDNPKLMQKSLWVTLLCECWESHYNWTVVCVYSGFASHLYQSCPLNLFSR